MKKTYILLIALSFAACKKNDTTITTITDGTYIGSFNYSNINPAVDYAAVTGGVTLTMRSQTYTCTSPSANFGAAAKGSFTLASPNIIFRDSTVHTANFDGNIVLKGTYVSTVRNDSLFLIKTIGTSVYSYKLRKQ